ncbi:MAG: hypothetical protein KDE53_23380 [Caldilineaceae bacterium]|nr:hypothetical protein [Caldilineaceae bacterium]
MNTLVLTPKFRRAYRRFARRNRRLQSRIDATLQEMKSDIWHPTVGTHKLSGNLFGLWACSCGYGCRIVFSIEGNAEADGDIIVLLDIGTRDEVY